jgi:hypothetical protein
MRVSAITLKALAQTALPRKVTAVRVKIVKSLRLGLTLPLQNPSGSSAA